MRQTQTSTDKVSQRIINVLWTEAKGVTLSEEWIGTTRFEILRTRPPEGHTWVEMEDLRKSKRLPDQTVRGLKLGSDFHETKDKHVLLNGQNQNAKLQASRCITGIYEVLTDDKDYFKVIADARLKLEKDTGPAVPESRSRPLMR